MRALLAVALFGLAGLAAAAEVPPSDPELARGIEEVKAGQHEVAIETLQSVVRRLYGDATQAATVALAYVHMGAAHVARGDTDAAAAVFDAALEMHPKLRLAPGTLPPEAAALFHEVARKRSQTAAPARSAARRRRLGKVALGTLGAGAAATGLVAARGRGEAPSAATFSNLRFATPLLLCPDGAANLPLPFTMLVEAVAHERLMIREAWAAAVNPATINVRTAPNFVRPTLVTPRELVPDGPITLQLDSTVLCTNLAGNPPTVTQWRGAATFETSAGRFFVETQERMVVQQP